MIKRLLIAMFAGPAALGVLAKLDDRLNFTPLIERIVLNFKAVTEGFWQIVSIKINFDLTQYGDLLSILLLLLLPILFQLSTSSFANKTELNNNNIRPNSIEELKKLHNQEMSALLERAFYYLGCFYFVYFVFHLFGYGGLVFILIMPGMLFEYLSKEFRTKKINSQTKLIYISYFNIFLYLAALFIVFPFLLKIVLVESNPALFSDIHWIYIFLFGLCFSWIFFRASDYCCVAITNTALWVMGVLLVNWVSTNLIPSVDKFLNSVNA